VTERTINPFTTEGPLMPIGLTRQQLWARALTDRWFGGERESLLRSQVGSEFALFYIPEPTMLNAGENVIFGISEALEPVKLRIKVAFNSETGGAGMDVKVEKATLKELGLDEKSLEMLVQRILAGGE